MYELEELRNELAYLYDDTGAIERDLTHLNKGDILMLRHHLLKAIGYADKLLNRE